MADLQISALPALGEAGIQATDVLALADISATETKKVTVKDLIAAGAALIDSGDIPAAKVATPFAADSVATATIQNLAVTTAKIANGAITATQITDATITGAKLVNDTVTATQIAANAVTASELADNAVDTAAIAANAVTTVKITDANVTYAKLNLSDGDIPGAKIASGGITATQLATNSVTATELADNAVDTAAVANAAITGAKIASTTIAAGNIVNNTITSTQLADNAVGTDQIADGAVTAAKLSGTIAATSIANDAVTTAKIADDAVDSSKLAPNAVDATALANNAVDAGAIATGAVTNAKLAANAVTDAKITDGTITAAKLNTSNIDRSLNVASGNLGINNTVTAATRSGISYNAQGLITGTVALAAGDLPVATTSAVGGISVGTGLSVSGTGTLSITNSVTGTTVNGITFNNQGLITSGSSLVSGDLPVATTSAKGAVQITSGGGLAVDGSGNLSTAASGITAGTYTKLTVTTKGIATAGASLAASDIPNLAASKITSGTIDAARIGANTIDGSKLSGTSTAIFQSIAQSGYPTAQFAGQILFDTVSEDAFIWDGNAWQAITTLTKGSLVFGGTYDAGTSQMVACTSAGIAAGLVVGSNLPTASATTDGLYVVVSSSGTPQSPAPAIAFAPPDYILGVTNSSGSGWYEVDLSQTIAGQVASNISFTPYGQLSSTNVQDALQELETEKLAKSGGLVTGELLISNTGSLVFEGATVDGFETTLTVADPTLSDKTITFPDITGTVITSGDTNTVTSTMVDASLANANLSATAAIAFSKLAALNSAQILVGNGSNVATAVSVTGDIGIDNAGLTSITAGAIVNADVNASAAIAGSKITTGTTSAVGVLQLTDSTSSTSTTTAATPNAVKTAYDLAAAAIAASGGTLTGDLLVDNDKEVRFYEADGNGTAYVGIKGATDKGSESSYTISLPAASPTAGQILKANASTPTTLEWSTDSATDSTKMPLAGGTFSGSVNLNGSSGDKLTIEDDRILQIGGGTSAGNGKTQLYFSTAGSTYYNVWNSVGKVALTTSHDFDHQISGVSHFTIASNLITSKKDHHIEGDLNFVETGTGSNYVGFKAPAAITTDLTWTLPAADATSSGQVLTSDGSGVLSWSTVAGTTINNNADNRLITGSGTANTLEGESGLTFDGSTLAVTGAATVSGTATVGGLQIDDNDYLKIGTGGDLWVYHENTGNTTRLLTHHDRTLDINYYDASLYKSMVLCHPKGSVNLFYDGGQRLATSTLGITVNGTTTTTGVDLGDDNSIQWGADDDLVITHQLSTGKNRIICYHARTLHVERYDGTDFEDMITAVPDGAVSLFFAGASKLTTSNTGVSIAGNCNITGGGVTLNDNHGYYSGGTNDLELIHDGSNSYLRHGGEGDLFVETTGTDEDIYAKAARDVYIQTNVNSTAGGGVDNSIICEHNGAVKLHHDNDLRFSTSGAGATLSGTLVTDQITSTGNITMSGTGAIDVAAGSTAQRPSSASAGMFRYNSDDGAFEGYTASGWGAIGGGGGSTSYTAITSNTTAAAGDAYLANTTSAGFTVTLPASPSAGDTVVVADAGGTWATNNLSVARNGQNIMGSATNLTCNVNGAVVSLIYSGVTANGWIATPN